MEKAVECLISRHLRTDWFSLLHTLACHGLSPLLSHLLLCFCRHYSLFFILTVPLSLLCYWAVLCFGVLMNSEVPWASSRTLCNVLPDWLQFLFLHVSASHFIILILFAAWHVQMLCGICWHLSGLRYIPYSYICQWEMHQGGAMCHSIILAAACSGGQWLCFLVHIQAAGTWKRPFHP